MRFLLFLLTLACASAWPVQAQAQDPVQVAPAPAHVSFVEGTAAIEHSDGESEAATLNMPVMEGDRVRTSNGRVSVMFPDGSSIDIDPDSLVEFVTTTRVRVLAGAMEHRAAPAVDPRSPSAQYLPPDLRPYGPDLDQAGSWQYEPQYGSVWYPSVGADWRPYYNGYWDPVPTYGLTWIGYDPWAWPTHHYGRWGYARSRWFWIPGRSWAAAWVSWGTGPDYVGWCPLGWDSRPVLALSVGYRSSWNAWTIMRRDQFARHEYSARRYGFEPYRLAATTPFIEHRRAPVLSNTGRVSVVGSDRRADRDRSLGVAVPRYPPSPDGSRTGYGAAGGQASPDRDRRGSVQGPPTYDRSWRTNPQPQPDQQPVIVGGAPANNGRRTTGDGRRATDDGRPATDDGRPAPGDSRAYRPRYQPRYEPQSQPNDAPPQAVPRYERQRRADEQQAPRVYERPRNPPSLGEPQRELRRAGEPPPSYERGRARESAPPPVAPRAERSNGSGAAGGAQAAPEHRGGDRGGDHGRARPEGSQTTGTAVRRPR